MNFNYLITTEGKALWEVISKWNVATIACDLETHGSIYDKVSRRILGFSFSNGVEAIYVPWWQWENGRWVEKATGATLECVMYTLTDHSLIGHNFTYDKRWIEEVLGLDTEWVADTRIMWHLASAPSGPRPYGLKDGQIELLGWKEKGDEELSKVVKAEGGRLSNGDHYLAPLDILGKYACLDTLSTHQIYTTLSPFFEKHNYWEMLNKVMKYNLLLDENTFSGILVNRSGLERAQKRLTNKRDAAMKRLNKELANAINSLERDWADRKIAAYKREYNKTWFANHPERWKRFNWNSDADKRELFYDKLRNEVVWTTEGGKPAVSADSVKWMEGSFVEPYLTYEKANTLVTNFVNPYLHNTVDSRIHPGFNICGTVSYRLSGFKPYFLNAPFEERYVMRNFTCDEGYVGLHADLCAIEPTITAHFSEDKSLLKVFRDGLGDIYLDLALELFPNDKELQNGYNPHIPCTSEIKRTFERQRKIAKVIQLAVQYTGTGFTVAKNLTKGGLVTSVPQAHGYVRSYWRKFSAVSHFDRQLHALFKRQGYIRNVIGRIIRVPEIGYKDLGNRFIQSSGHDCLMLWALRIDEKRKERNVSMRPVLLDCHDSTSWQIKADQFEEGEKIFKEALAEVNAELGLCVPIKAEYKKFVTMAGLKGEEE